MQFLMAALVLAASILPAAAGTYRIDHDGVARSFEVVPAAGPRSAPAIVVLHGGAGTPDRMRRITGFTLHERGWVEIYPAGIDRQWNDGRTGADGTPLRTTDDLGFLRAMIGRLAADGIIDPRRVYFTGASNGGAMTLRLLCEAPELVAGAAVVIMNLPVRLDCPDSPPVPLIFIHGTDDPLVPFGGGPITVGGDTGRGAVLSAADTLARFAWRNRCGAWDEIALPDTYPDDGTRVRLRAYRGCAQPLMHYIIDGGGHTWPGNRNRRWVEKLLGTTALDISATFEIEAFFTGLNGR